MKVYTVSEMIEAIQRRIDHLQGRVTGRFVHAVQEVEVLEAAIKTLTQIRASDV